MTHWFVKLFLSTESWQIGNQVNEYPDAAVGLLQLLPGNLRMIFTFKLHKTY
ncbi:hypothetical protein X975_24638, partial [Stegodyphus mimosarum]